MFFSVDFWRFTSERAIKSFAQSLLAVLSVGGLGLLEVNWITALSTAGMATLLVCADFDRLISSRPQRQPERHLVDRGPRAQARACRRLRRTTRFGPRGDNRGGRLNFAPTS